MTARALPAVFQHADPVFIGLASRKLYGENRGWAAAIILIGSIGMLVRSHEMITDLALLTGCAMMLYGFALSQERHVRAGLLIGTGVGIGFMAKGLSRDIVYADRRAAARAVQQVADKELFPQCGRCGPGGIAMAHGLALLLYLRSRSCLSTGLGRTTSATGWTTPDMDRTLNRSTT